MSEEAPEWIVESDEIPKRHMEVHYDKSWNLLCRALHRNFVVAGDQAWSGVTYSNEVQHFTFIRLQNLRNNPEFMFFPAPSLCKSVCVFLCKQYGALIFFCALCIFPRVYHEFYAGVQWHMNFFFSDHSFTMKRFFIVSTIEARKNIFCACWLNQKQLFVALRLSILYFGFIDYN